MRKFEIIECGVDLYWRDYIYQVEAESEEEAVNMVKKGEVDWVDTTGGDYGDFNKEIAQMFLNGELLFIEIDSVRDITPIVEDPTTKLLEEKESLQKRMDEINKQLNK